MTRFSVCLLVILFINVVIGSKHLPPYITACKKTDPNINECAKQRAIDALPYILKGDRAYKFSSYNPFEIEAVESTGTSGINLNLKKLRLFGLDKAEIKEIIADLKNNQIVVKVFIPETRTEAEYNAKGKIFSVEINDQGPAIFTGYNVSVAYTVDFQLITKKDGKRYIDINNLKTHLDLKIDKNHYYFGNLFGGNKVLGDSFNNVVNENSEEVDGISKDTNASIVNSIVITILKALFKVVPYDEIFAD